MIPNNINSENELNLFLYKLGFKPKTAFQELENVLLDKNTMLYFTEHESIAIYYFDTKSGLDILATSLNKKDGSYHGYKEVIKFLNEEFKEFFRKEKIAKLLNDSN